jgi:hypothetical protein
MAQRRLPPRAAELSIAVAGTAGDDVAGRSLDRGDRARVLSFASHSYIVVERFIDARLARILFGVLQLRRWRGEAKRDDQVPGALSHWGDSTLDALLLDLMPAVEEAAGHHLLPTYAYARLYLAGDQLPRHRDREEAQIAVSVHLGHTGPLAPPPIRFAPAGQAEIVVAQSAGDAVIYRGDAVEHWRDRFDGETFGQLFLNYVRADGDRRGRIYDGRQADFPPDIRRTIDERRRS